MKNRIGNRDGISLFCGLGSWILFVLSMLTMDLSSRWIAYGLAALWIASALVAVIVAVAARYRLGIRKNRKVGVGMLLGTVMIFVQIFVFGLSFLQQNTEWETSSVGLVSLGCSCAVAAVFLFLYRLLGRKGQERIEAACDEESVSE